MESTPHADPGAAGAVAAPADVVPPAADATVAEATDTTDPSETLSPAVRRLIRQYDLDITAIHGTGPSGRIRVGDVIGMLGGRATEAPPLKPVERPHAVADLAPAEAEESRDEREDDSAGTATRGAAPLAAAPTTTVFECDLSRVLAHRKRLRASDVDVLLTSYFIVALGDAAHDFPELTPDEALALEVHVTAADGAVHALRATAARPAFDQRERLRDIDSQLRANRVGGEGRAHLVVHHYGASGSLLATPTPLGVDGASSVGIGRVRREIVVRANDAGEEAPRVAALCNVSLSFLPDRLPFDRANTYVAAVVRALETWPD